MATLTVVFLRWRFRLHVGRVLVVWPLARNVGTLDWGRRLRPLRLEALPHGETVSDPF